MKNAIILHGAGETPRSFWYPWAKRELTRRGYRVWAPQLPPKGEMPKLAVQLPFVLSSGTFTAGTVFIGHSAGVPLALSVLERLETRIAQAILVAGFSAPLKSAAADAILQKHYDWKKIRSHVKSFIFIHSDNDPWGCDDKQGRRMFDHLGGTLVIAHGEGHFGSHKFRQPYKTFPLLLKLLCDTKEKTR